MMGLFAQKPYLPKPVLSLLVVAVFVFGATGAQAAAQPAAQSPAPADQPAAKPVERRDVPRTAPTRPAAGPEDRKAADKKAEEKKAGEKKKAEGKGAAAPPAGRVNINTASQEEIRKKLEISNNLAERIVDGRPYRKPEDIQKIGAFKGKGYDKVKGKIAVD